MRLLTSYAGHTRLAVHFCTVSLTVKCSRLRTSSRADPKSFPDCGNTCYTAVKTKDYIFHPYQKRCPRRDALT